MSTTPLSWNVYDPDGRHVADCLLPETALDVVERYGKGAKVKFKHEILCWSEGHEEDPASLDPAGAAQTCRERRKHGTELRRATLPVGIERGLYGLDVYGESFSVTFERHGLRRPKIDVINAPRRTPAGNLTLKVLDDERVSVAHVALTPAEWEALKSHADRVLSESEEG